MTPLWKRNSKKHRTIADCTGEKANQVPDIFHGQWKFHHRFNGQPEFYQSSWKRPYNAKNWWSDLYYDRKGKTWVFWRKDEVGPFKLKALPRATSVDLTGPLAKKLKLPIQFPGTWVHKKGHHHNGKRVYQ